MTESFARICVIGLGYVGLPTAAVVASRGLDVLGVDVNREAVALINQGKIHIVEPELDILVKSTVAAGRLHAALEPEPADVFIIAVPTPFKDDHRPDLSYVEAATRALAPVVRKGNLVVVESTSPVGTTEMVSRWLGEAHPELRFPHEAGDAADVQVAHSPERVLPGQVLLEMVRNDRVIGGISRVCARRAAAFYRLFVNGQCVETDARTAELVKLSENAYRDVNIAFANELSIICDRLGLDVWEVISLTNRHPRVNVLQPGPGVGGHCIAVDPWFIVDSAPEDARLIRTARLVNDAKPAFVVGQVTSALRLMAGVKAETETTIACLGLSYKPDIDDLRESPAVAIVEQLARSTTAEMLVVEPHVTALPGVLADLPRVRRASLDQALSHADVVVLLVDHRAFRALDRARLSGKIVVDTRGAWR